MQRERQAYFWAALTVLCWSTVAAAFKVALRGLTPRQLLCYAAVTSTIVLYIILLAQGKGPLLREQTPRDWCRSALLGALNPLLYYLVLFKAYDLLPAQEAQPLNYTWPIVLSILAAVCLRQKLTATALLGLCLSFVGVAVISTRGNLTSLRPSNVTGCALAVGSSVIWASFWILNLRDERDPVLKLFMGFLCGSACIVALLLCQADAAVVAPRYVLAAVYVGLFEMGLTFVFWLNALRLAANSASVSNLAYLAPFLSLVFIRVIVNERIRTSSVLGLALIVTGILIQTWSQRAARGPGAAAPCNSNPDHSGRLDHADE